MAEEYLKGSKAMQRKMEQIAKRFPDKLRQALKMEAELVMTDSKRNYVPVDLGTLRSSGTVGDPVREGDHISITLSYGGAAAAYALAQHEFPSDHNPPSWEGKEKLGYTKDGTGVKYLERPLMAAIPGMAERIASQINLDKDKV